MPTLPLEEFLTHFAPPYRTSADAGLTPRQQWEKALAADLADTLEAARVRNLARDITLNSLQRPVRVTVGGCDPEDIAEGECTGEPDCCPPSVANGHHRTLAHVILDAPTITYSYEENEPAGEHVWTETEVALPPEVHFTDEAVDNLLSLLSFRLTNDHWAECEILSISRDRVTIMWGCNLEGAYQNLTECLPQRFALAGAPTPLTLTHSQHHESELDDL